MAERRQLEKISVNNTKEVILQVVPYEDYGNTCTLHRLPEAAAHKKLMVPQKRNNFFAISTRHIRVIDLKNVTISVNCFSQRLLHFLYASSIDIG